MCINVLVVEGSDIVRSDIARTMRMAELPIDSVYEAANSGEALRVLGESWIDVVLADFRMSMADDRDLIVRMRSSRETAGIPVVAVTSEDLRGPLSELEELGVSALLRHPFTPQQVRDVMASLPNMPSDGRLLQTIEHVSCEVLGEFARLSVEPSEYRFDLAADDFLLGSTGVSGAVTGVVSVAAPLGLCRQLACRAFGADGDDEVALNWAHDALGELSNVIAGCLVSELQPHGRTVFMPPLVTSPSADDWYVLGFANSTVCLTVEGWPFLTSFVLGARQ